MHCARSLRRGVRTALCFVVKGKDGKNKITGYVDFSYINPYDYLRRPVAAVMNAVERGEELNLDGTSIVYDALSGVLTEMLSPFAEESIMSSVSLM